MSAFIKNENLGMSIDDPKWKFSYPEEMKKLVELIKPYGVLNIDYHLLEKAWYIFSEGYSAQFLTVTEEYIPFFVDFLSEQDETYLRICDYYGELRPQSEWYDSFYDDLMEALEEDERK